MPRIQANRESIDDRFSVLGFTIRSESPLFEVGVATDPALFNPARRGERNRRNFFSSRSAGVMRARRGEAVYLVPPDVLANFVGQPRLYFGLATYRENSRGQPDFVQAPSSGNMYVNLGGLTERGLRRLNSSARSSSYEQPNGSDPSLDWGGDAWPQVQAGATPAPVPATPPAAAAPGYDDGFGRFPDTSTPVAAPPAAPVQEPAASAPAAAVAQSLSARQPLARAQEIITPYYDPADPSSALTCQADAFSQAREEWFAGVPNAQIFPHSAICMLKMVAPDGRRYNGTGFYIASDRVLTCAHNLDGMREVTIIPGHNGAGDKPFGECTLQSDAWRIAKGYGGTGDWARDLAVIDNVPLAAPGGRWFSFLNATPSDRLPIVVCGYSKGSDAVKGLTDLIDGEKQHLHGGFAASQSDPEVIEYPLLTLKGNSGSPVYHLAEGDTGLEARVCAVHVTGEPAAQGLNRGCFITPAKIDWIEGRTVAFGLGLSAAARRRSAAPSRPLGDAAISVHWDSVPYLPQTSTKSCWAASAAMVVGWRDQVSIADSEIARMVPVIDAYRKGLWPRERRQLADAWNLVAEPPASYTVEAWGQMLQDHGPLYIDMTWDASGGGHARVLVGMESDGNPDGSGTTMYMHDPWPDTPGRIKLPFGDFLALYENRTGNSGGVFEYQILHADSVPAGLAPVTAAPFALTLAAQLDAGPAETGERSEPPLPEPPPPVVQQLQRDARSLALPAVAVEIASVVSGATMERIVNNEGDVTWELDQLRGYKHPDDVAPSPMPASQDGAVIRLTEWPYVENLLGDRISAGFEINWQYNGKSVGNVMVSNVATNDAVGHGLSVKAKIMDDNIVYPRDNPSFAALKVRFEYRFTRVAGNDAIAIQDVHLFGNGRYNLSGRWEQT